MTNFQLLTIIGSILIPMLSGFGWIIIRFFKMETRFSKMEKDSNNRHIELLKEIRVLDSRLSHLEGYLIGINQRTGTESIKEKK